MHTSGVDPHHFTIGSSIELVTTAEEVTCHHAHQQTFVAQSLSWYCFAQEIAGEVLAFDQQRLFLLQPGSKATLRNLRLLKTDHIKV